LPESHYIDVVDIINKSSYVLSFSSPKDLNNKQISSFSYLSNCNLVWNIAYLYNYSDSYDINNPNFVLNSKYVFLVWAPNSYGGMIEMLKLNLTDGSEISK